MKAHTATPTQQNATEWASTTNGTPTPLFDRIVDVLDAHTDIGIVDCADGRSILTWETTCDLATAIASDQRLAALIAAQNTASAA